MRQTWLTTALVVAGLCAVGAQGPATQNPIAGGQKMLFSMVKNNIIRSAEKMPEENYGFKPAPEVRSFGQLIGHVADSQYMFCAPVLGKPNPAPGIEKSKVTKADLVQAVKDAFAAPGPARSRAPRPHPFPAGLQHVDDEPHDPVAEEEHCVFRSKLTTDSAAN